MIADDHPIFRQGVKTILNDVAEISVVAEADDGVSALSLLHSLRPDLLLLDLAMPHMDGLSVLKAARPQYPDLLVIIITSYRDNVYLDNALAMGANGFVLKDDVAENLVDCIKKVLNGEVYISPSFDKPEPMLPLSDEKGSARLAELTRMECKVLALVSRYMTSKEIAIKLHISYRTVQNHRTNISAKLGIKGIHRLADFAHQHQDKFTGLFEN